MRAKLSELGTVITGNTPSKQESKYWASSDIPFIKPDVINQDGITELQAANEYISEIARSKARIVEKSVVLVTCIGSIGKICLTGRECAFNQQINAIIPNDKVLPEYLAYCIYYNRPRLIELANAPVVPIINKRQFENFSINIEENIGQQGSIVTILKAVDRLIYYRHKQLQKLDELVKARFVELFGDPISNPHGFDKVDLSELADIKIGPFGSLLHKEDYIEGGYALLNPSHIIDGKIAPDSKLTVSREKYEELSAYRLKAGDVVMGRRGEMGRCAVVPCDGYLCGTGSLLIRTKGDVTADYIQKIISFPSFKKAIEDMAVGQTMPNLNVPIVSSFQIIKPPIEVQHSYYAFVEQTDKSKVAVQKALDETQLLFDSLMQKYFE